MAVAVAPIVSLLLLASLLLLPAAAHAVDVAGVANSNNAPPVHKCIHDTEAFRQHVADAKRKSGVTVALQSYETLNAYRELARETAKGSRNETLAPPPPTSDVGPIRIAWSTLDLDDPTHYCTAVGQTVPNFMGGTATCTDVTILTPAKRDILLKKVLPAAVARLAKAISVHRVLDNLMVPSQSVCSEPWSVPVNHTVEGVPNSDYVLYVAAAPTTGGTIAFAAYCAHDENGRPVIGRMNFSPEFLQWNDVDPSQNGLVLNTAAHELTHALGFTYDFFQSGFKDKRSAVLGTTVRGGQPAQLVNSTSVVAAARAYFGCDSLRGMELENEGGAGTSNSHWDRRNVMQELMIGAGGSRLSTITLSLLQDTGYYFVDFSKAEPMTWGANASCAFIDEKCDSTSPLYPQYWCNDTNPQNQGCTFDFRAIGYCATGTYSSALPTYWQYFSNPNIGGTTQLLDYCPIMQSYSDSACPNASYIPSASDVLLGNRYDARSRCFVTSPDFIDARYEGSADPVRCLSVRCLGGAWVQFSADGVTWGNCSLDGSAGTAAAPPGFHGSVRCPEARRLCSDTSLYWPPTTTAPVASTTASSPATAGTNASSPLPSITAPASSSVATTSAAVNASGTAPTTSAASVTTALNTTGAGSDGAMPTALPTSTTTAAANTTATAVTTTAKVGLVTSTASSATTTTSTAPASTATGGHATTAARGSPEASTIPATSNASSPSPSTTAVTQATTITAPTATITTTAAVGASTAFLGTLSPASAAATALEFQALVARILNVSVSTINVTMFNAASKQVAFTIDARAASAAAALAANPSSRAASLGLVNLAAAGSPVPAPSEAGDRDGEYLLIGAIAGGVAVVIIGALVAVSLLRRNKPTPAQRHQNHEGGGGPQLEMSNYERL